MKRLFTFAARTLACFRRDERGVSALEFALVAPMMLGFYLGTVEVSRALSVSRNVTNISSSVGDLVSQQKSITNADLNGIMQAAEKIISPLSSSTMKIHISSYCMNSSNTIVKDWDYSYNSGTSTINTSSSEVTGLIQNPGESLVVAEVEYTYNHISQTSKIMKMLNPNATAFDASTRTVTDKFFLRPRNVAYITKSGDTNSCL